MDVGTYAESVKRVAKAGEDDVKRQEAFKALEEQLRQLRKGADGQYGTRIYPPTPASVPPPKRCMAAGTIQPRKRPALAKALGDYKRTQPRVEEESESEAQSTDIDNSVQNSIEKWKYQRARSRCHQLETSTPDTSTGSCADHAGSESSEHETILQKSQRSIKRANGRSASAPVYKTDTLDESRTPIAPRNWAIGLGHHRRGYTPLLDASQRDLQNPVHSLNLPSIPPSTPTVPKVSSPPPPPIPTSNTTTDLELTELMPAQYIDSMNRALYKTEEINADLTNIEEEGLSSRR
jgi:hypothetical protein